MRITVTWHGRNFGDFCCNALEDATARAYGQYIAALLHDEWPHTTISVREEEEHDDGSWSFTVTVEGAPPTFATAVQERAENIVNNAWDSFPFPGGRCPRHLAARNGLRMWEIKAANKRAGLYYFEPDTMRFFRSRVSDTVYQGPGGVFFITSEKSPNGARRHSVRRFKPASGDCETAPGTEFCSMTRSQAVRLAGKMARGVPGTV